MQTYTALNPDPSFPYPPQYWFPPFFTIQPNSTTRLAQFRAWSDLIQAYCRHHRIFKISVVDAAATAASTAGKPGGSTGGKGERGGSGGGGKGSGGGGKGSGGVYAGWPLFHNREISRRLDVRGISEVLRWMSSKGTGAGANDSGDKGVIAGGSDGGGGGGGRAERFEGEKETDEGGTYWIYWRTPEEWAGVLMDWVERTGQRGSVLTLYEIAEGEGSLAEEFHGMDADLLKRCLQILVKRGKSQIFGQSDQLGVKFF